MKTIQLPRGYTAIVDDEWFDELSAIKWCVIKCRDWQLPYAMANDQRLMHRIVFGETPKGQTVDHINNDTMDNRRENLRLATMSQNKANCRRPKNNTSGYKGVQWEKDRQKWTAKVGYKGVQRRYGSFSTKEEAAACYAAALRKLFGEFARIE